MNITSFEFFKRRECFFLTGLCHFNLREYSDAIISFNKTLEVDQNHLETKLLLEHAQKCIDAGEVPIAGLIGFGLLGCTAAVCATKFLAEKYRSHMFPEWQEAAKVVESVEKRIKDDNLHGVGVSAGVVGIVLWGFMSATFTANEK